MCLVGNARKKEQTRYVFFNDEPNAYVFATFRGTNAYVCGVCVECVCGLCLVEILKQANAYVFGL